MVAVEEFLTIFWGSGSIFPITGMNKQNCFDSISDRSQYEIGRYVFNVD